ncbi:hypothetical protein T01_5316 [Trichinella spiralis]|uniref:Uncharacterized protein n=1 Tax=Trichinella spiralis TaxID=6334 RepID=A0A0V1ATE4_TRISP|nr:hypothetical protein T01_5316 [Trichinella spiralis]
MESHFVKTNEKNVFDIESYCNHFQPIRDRNAKIVPKKQIYAFNAVKIMEKNITDVLEKMKNITQAEISGNYELREF